jgi:hypothetical protein
MKPLLFLISAICISTSCASQTKAETQTWLSYYLGKYFGSDYNQEIKNRSMKGEWWNDKKYHYTTYEYSFQEKYLNIRECYREQDTTGYARIIKTTTTSINLKRVIMVEPSIDTITYKFIGVEIKFSEPEYDNKDNVIEYSILKFDNKGQPLTDFNSYSLNFHIRSENDESVQSRIESKLAKAILHLAELNGAKVVKELFSP